MAAWLVGSERTAPHQLGAEWGQLRRATYEKMGRRFLHCLHDQLGLVQNDIEAFEGCFNTPRPNGLEMCVRDTSQQGRGWTT